MNQATKRCSRRLTTKAAALAAVAVLAMAIGTGCANEAKKPTPQQSANNQWNMTRAVVMISLAKEQYEAGQFDKARQTINDAIKLAPESAAARVLSARIAIEEAQLELAEKELRFAKQFDPKNAEADYLTGVIYQRWQKPDQAYESYSRACEKAPSELAYLLAKSEMLVAMDRAPEALKMLQERVVFFEHSAAIRDAVGELLVQQKKYADAIEMLRTASVLTPDDNVVREHLAMALYYGKQYDEAVAVLTRLTSTEKFTKRADLFATIGEAQCELGRYREARDAFENATRLDPSTPGLWLGYGKVALQLNDLRRAEVSLKKALAMDPASSEANLLLGYLRLRQDRLPEALAAFKKVSALDTADTVSLCMTGYTLQKLGRNEEAIQYYGKALKRNPKDELANKLMAGADLRE